MRNGTNLERPMGLHALIEKLDLKVPPPVVRSIGWGGNRRTNIREGYVLECYPRGYEPEDSVLGHLRFALKYEPLDLGVYKAALLHMDPEPLERWIQGEPNGLFARRAWYLYELFTGLVLKVDDLTSGPYGDLLNANLHIVGPPTRIRRQRILDNLLGNKDFCPMIRRTERIDAALAEDLKGRAQALVATVEPSVLKRAVHYLYAKETRSSFAIEGEAPGPGRSERFVSALTRADHFDPGEKASFVALQNAIVDPRYAQADWRNLQVYVGETLPDFSQTIHFTCPKPEDVPGLMDGWMRMITRISAPGSPLDAVCAAAAGAFGFVFLHPFLDGNGRIHRFLVHSTLAKMGFSPQGLVFPVSVVMQRDRAGYDRALEAFSAGIAPFVEYKLDARQEMRVLNETADLYGFFDATPQTEYLLACIAETIRRDLEQELGFLTFFDRAMQAVMDIVDMPNQRASHLIRLVHQNRGKLAKVKRRLFAEVTDGELARIEAAIKDAALP